MASHNELGKKGEELAKDYLLRNGYVILHTNWRHSYYEIDIIALKQNKLHFIEVKTRRSAAHGHPEESVTKRKFKYLQQAADEYLHMYPEYKWIQYDILSIIIPMHSEPNFFLLEDIFL